MTEFGLWFCMGIEIMAQNRVQSFLTWSYFLNSDSLKIKTTRSQPWGEGNEFGFMLALSKLLVENLKR